MHSTKIHKLIVSFMSFFYYTGIWNRGDKPTMKDIRIKWCYCGFYSLFILSMIAGIIENEEIGKKVVLVENAFGASVVLLNMSVLIWKQSEIYDLLQRVCIFAIKYSDDYDTFNSKITKFTKVASMYLAGSTGGAVLLTVISFAMHTLFYEIGFPLDWRNSETAFYLAAAFFSAESFLALPIISFSTIIWYLLYVCSLRYEVLASELRNMGHRKGLKAEQEEENHAEYRNDLRICIDTHLRLRKLTLEVGSLFSHVFLLVLTTSGVSICGSVYCLAFDIAENAVERCMFIVILFYFLADIFMVTYFGNEITLSYDRLSYSLFESNWIDASQSTRKSVIIFGEYLKEPLMLTIGKLYPLTLTTFTSILDSAYSMFNILKTQS